MSPLHIISLNNTQLRSVQYNNSHPLQQYFNISTYTSTSELVEPLQKLVASTKLALAHILHKSYTEAPSQTTHVLHTLHLVIT